MKLVSAAFVLGIFSFSAYAAPTTYPLVCRGGGGMYFQVSQGNALVRTYFKRGTAPSSSGVPAGYCSWIDRAVSPSEPMKLCHSVNDVVVAWKDAGNVIQLVSSQAPYLTALRSSAQTAIFQVYNDGNGCFRVTRLGP